MVKLTYLSAALIAAAMNLVPAAHASPAGLTATMDVKAEPTGLDQNFVEVNAVIHAFTDLGAHRAVFTLFPEQCQTLPGAAAEICWRKSANFRVTAYRRNFDGTCNCTTAPFELKREDHRYDVQAYPCIQGVY
ncbi:hypothetical protein W97_01219 [Coniosporium apollinis CBS 100218]|uniref:Uncharacterized protein n=1 Tax=Coniosporium apollinis (strain CBS 100218) TaxID=1168221 RepID=R7YJC4_CONA1|nr:uncharacterized protein W97_01219 [Coniosporium apollinis CBS 100218]EON62000.1 hypothetical protein W97_01219 [Coniosporium apollinis CBS 100218]